MARKLKKKTQQPLMPNTTDGDIPDQVQNKVVEEKVDEVPPVQEKKKGRRGGASGSRKGSKKSGKLQTDEVLEKDEGVEMGGVDGLKQDDGNEEPAEPVKKRKRGTTSMWKLIAARSRGKKLKVRYDSLGRALYEDNKPLQSYIGHVARSMVTPNINRWKQVPKDIKDKIWEEVQNVFEVAPQAKKSTLRSANEKWRDWKSSLTTSYVWPNRKNPEWLRSTPPEEYQIAPEIWREFVDIRLDPSWKLLRKVQKSRTKQIKYRHKASRKGYIGVEADIRKKDSIPEDVEIDRSVLWVEARKDPEGKIHDAETAAMAARIDKVTLDKAKGKFIPEGMHDVLREALGTEEKYGRVRGVGGHVKPQQYFGTARKTREPVSKVLAESLKEKTEEAASWKAEAERLRAELAAQKEAAGTAESSKKSSNTKVSSEPEEVAVEQISSKLERRNCKAATNVLKDVDDPYESQHLKRKVCKTTVEDGEVQSKKYKSVVAELVVESAPTDALRTVKTTRPLTGQKHVDAAKSEALKKNGKKAKVDVQTPVNDCHELDPDALKGRPCMLALHNRDNVVAYGTIISLGGPNEFVHTVPIGIGNWKVSIDGVVDDSIDEDIPVPIKNGPDTLVEAVGAIVAWPKDLVILTETQEKEGEELANEEAICISDGPDDDDDKLMRKGKRTGAKKADAPPVPRSKLKDVEMTLPVTCKVVYSHADKLMSESKHMPVALDEAMFGKKRSVWLSRDKIMDFMEMQPLGGPQILAYEGLLYNYLKAQQREITFSFVDPGAVPYNGPKTSLNEKHIIDRLTESPMDSICLIPYNPGQHWVLTIISDRKDKVYLLDPMSNRSRHEAWKNTVLKAVKEYNSSKGKPKGPVFKQLTGNLKQNPNTLECGYCVLRYMKEIVECEDPDFEAMFGGTIKDKYYTQSQYDEVREEWSQFILA